MKLLRYSTCTSFLYPMIVREKNSLNNDVEKFIEEEKDTERKK